MKSEETPQDHGITEGLKEIRYAVDKDGRYVLTSSSGWEVVNIANRQAWNEIDRQVMEAAALVRGGKASVLAYYMAVNQMDEALLAKYAGLSRWRIRRHLKPKVFSKLNREIINRYAWIFRVTPEDLAAGKLPMRRMNHEL